jgi:hypothetical protein
VTPRSSQARTVLPGWLVDDLRVMFAHFQAHGLAAPEEELRTLEAVLGRKPRSFEAFARETASAWQA